MIRSPMFRTNPKRSYFAFTAAAFFPQCEMVSVHVHPIGKVGLDQHTAGTAECLCEDCFTGKERT